jgi:hypothetical protein
VHALHAFLFAKMAEKLSGTNDRNQARGRVNFTNNLPVFHTEAELALRHNIPVEAIRNFVRNKIIRADNFADGMGNPVVAFSATEVTKAREEWALCMRSCNYSREIAIGISRFLRVKKPE